MKAAGASCAAVVLLALLMFSTVARADVDDYLGRRIVNVEYVVEGRPSTEARLLPFVETRVGEPLSMAAVRETLQHLVGLGLFHDVVVRAKALEGGVALTFDLVPVHPVSEVAFLGALGHPEISEERLREAVLERFGASPPATRSDEIGRFLESQLQQRGYLGGLITSRIDVDHRSEKSTLVFLVEPGERTRIGRVLVLGTPGMSEGDTMNALGLSPGGWYDPDRLGDRIDAYLEERRRSGHFEARLTITTRFSEGDRVADINVTAVQGPRVIVTCMGDPLMTSERCTELVPVAREGSTDEDLLEDARNRIEGTLRSEGYLDASAPYQRQQTDDRLTITFTISRGRLYRVAAVAMSPDLSLPVDEILGSLRVVKGSRLSAADLDADVAVIEEFYRERGYVGVDVETSLTPIDTSSDESQAEVTVAFQITEGARTMVGSVRVEGNTSVPAEVLMEGLGLRAGVPFVERRLSIDRDAIERGYVDRGYASASVIGEPRFSEDGTVADIVFSVREGPQIFVDHVLVIGNDRTRAATILREVQINPGEPLGLADVVESQRRLASLGLFRRTRISELSHGDETSRDLVVSVEESPVTTVGYGGGLEVGQRINAEASGIAVAEVELAPRGFFEIGRRNLFGKNRSVTLYTGGSLKQKPSTTTDVTSGLGINEYRILGTFREPRIAGTGADAFLTGTIEQQIRSSFNFARRALGVEVAGVHPYVRLTGNYQLQRSEIFDERFSEDEALLVDRLFPQVRLSSFSGTVIRDSRDDQLSPSRGRYLSAYGQLAARTIGSEVGFAKSFFTAQIFELVPGTRRFVFAGSARLGLAAGFHREKIDDDGNRQVVKDLPASERFFVGGDTTVRGFALDQLGTPETIDANGFPLGGNALIIFNAELRVPLFRGLGVVGFVDTGNVFARTEDIQLSRLRSSLGFGFRYNSPVGPIRVDLGIKTNRQEVVPGQLEKLAAWHISLGQAF